MKIVAIYFILALLVLAMILSVDMLSGMSLFESFHSIRAVLANTSIQEVITMVFFLSLPFINAIAAAVRKGNSRR
ncbi:hypothetical protein GCM10010912_07710 [Paenibacillus albidus]|uniref:Uncharacterized protein n=1 Tax=Paenibacillus albidus TaxID=2041023 RepID=A0A917C189_9BACL|nr:hypothetical protein [Paenibacillus albidus]GGF65135.1 hypothetical protein GCM10010912_07710 [Paenibacillus albidus]